MLYHKHTSTVNYRLLQCMCVCLMWEDHKWGQQIFQFPVLAVFCCDLAPKSNWCQKHFLRKSFSSGQFLSLCITRFSNWDLKSIQDLSRKYWHSYRITTAPKSKTGGGEMAIWNRSVYSERPRKEGKRVTLMAFAEFAIWDCPTMRCVLRKVLIWSLVTSVEKLPVVPKGFGSGTTSFSLFQVCFLK